MTSRVPTRLAAYVKARAAGRCEYCRAPQILIGQAFHLDHIVPRSAKGLQDMLIQPASSAEAFSYLIDGDSPVLELRKDRFVK